MKSEEVKQIAEYMFDASLFKGFEYLGGENVRIRGFSKKERWRNFQPQMDRDNHKVFKALVYECKKRNLAIVIEKGILAVCPGDKEGILSSQVVLDVYEFNNESICLALIAVMESK